MSAAEFQAARLEARAGEGWITVTELADTLTREHDLPFKVSHAITARFVRAMQQRPDESPARALQGAAGDLLGRTLPYDDAQLLEILSPRHFVAVRKTLGGPAPEETGRALTESQAALQADRAWLVARTEALHAAENRLKQDTASL